MVVGAWVLYARICAGCLLCLLGCVNLAAIITTGVFRLNTQGKLAALSTQPIKYEGGLTTSDSRTYESDGKVILALWITSLVMCCCNCLQSYQVKGQQ